MLRLSPHLNQHYIVHASPDDPGQVHFTSPPRALMPAIPEGKEVAGSPSTTHMDTMLGFVQVRERGDRLAQPVAEALVTEMLGDTDTTP